LSNQVSTLLGRRVGGAQPNISQGIIRSLVVPLPPLPEQRRIAAILDKVNELRVKRRVALEQLNKLRASTFVSVFGDARSILTRWKVVELGDSLSFLTSGSRGWARYYRSDGDLFLRIQNVRRDELCLHDVAYVTAPDTAEAKRTKVQAGDVLLSITADLGRTAVIPENVGSAYINQHLAVLRTNAFAPRFLSAFLASGAGRLQVLGKNRQGVKAGLNFDDIRALKIPSPPRSLQCEFEQRMSKLDQLNGLHGRSQRKVDALFAALQHQAFTGVL
jgi:type I restriction enzyme S subunit